MRRNLNKRKAKSGIMAGVFLLMLVCLLLAATSATAGSYLHLSRGIVKCFDEGTNSWQVCSAGVWSPNQVTGVAVTYQSKAGESMTFTPAVGYEIKYVGANGWRTDTGYPPPEAATPMSPVGTPDTLTYTQWILINSYGGTNYYENIAVYVEPKPYTITRTAGAHGAIAGDAIVRHGNSGTYTMTPTAGYKVADVLVDGVSVGAVSSYTFENVTAPHTIHATFENNPPVITEVSCPAALQMGETGTCNASATATNGTVKYRWAASDSSFTAPQAASSNVYFLTGGIKVVTLEAYIDENPAAVTVGYASVEVTPINMTITGGCPAANGKALPFECSIVGTTDWGTMAYLWTADNADVIFNPPYAATTQAVGANIGERVITARVFLTERPHIFVEKTMNVSITQQPPVITGVTCSESNILLGQGVTCTVQATALEGTIGYEWTVSEEDGVVTAGNTSSATIRFKKPGEHTVNIRAFLTDYPTAPPVSSSATVTVADNPITATITCPQAGISGEDIVCTSEASAAWGTLKREWKTGNNLQSSVRAKDAVGYIKFFTPGNNTISLTVYLEEAPFVKTTVEQPIAIANGAQFKPVISGPKYTYVTMDTEYTITAPCLADETCTIKWTVDGEEKTGTTATFNFPTQTKVTITAQTMFNDGSPAKSETYYVYVKAIPKPMFSILGPSAMFVGKETEYTARISNNHSELPIVGKWMKETEEGTTITVLPEAAGTFDLDYSAWIDGYKELSYKTLTRRIKVAEYVFPEPKISIRSTEGSAPFMAAFRTVDTNRRVPGAPYAITYNWDFGDGETLETEKTPVTHVFKKSGTYTVVMTATDPDGNTSTDQVVMNIGVTPITVSIRTSASNVAMRAPLTVYARSNITKKAPLDRIESHEWLINNAIQQGTRAEYMKADLPDVGTYTITFNATMTSGATGTSSIEMTIVPNKPPTCTVSHTDVPATKSAVFLATCTDSDGRITGYRWDLDDGRGYRRGFTRASARVAETKTFNVKLEATDDAGGVVEVEYPVTITR